ncbi:unnamed protein product [Dibothriocephalus latus]|uniref:Uncharacterized protein n=1 Tax=Dibothriocephalus latus TaxID=60516 RepID=A0A3P7KYA0_DIBLA|nr:unnamed protein product [Dibothriocephalus latus]
MYYMFYQKQLDNACSKMYFLERRPAKDYLVGFIQRYKDWLIPDFLGKGTPEELATKLVGSCLPHAGDCHSSLIDETFSPEAKTLSGTVLICAVFYVAESPTIEDYFTMANLDKEQSARLYQLMSGVAEGKQMQLLMLGMPLGAWAELYFLFNRIASSGFLHEGTTD